MCKRFDFCSFIFSISALSACHAADKPVQNAYQTTVSKTETKSEAKPLDAFAQQSFHKFTSNGLVIGRSAFSWKREGGLLRFNENAEMKLTLFKKAEVIATQSRVWTNEALEIQKIEFDMKSSQSLIKIVGDRFDNILRLQISQAGKTQIKDLSLQEPVLVSSTLRPYLLLKGLPTQSKNLEAFMLEPSALTTVPMEMKVKKISDSKWSVNLSYLQHSMVSEITKDGSLTSEKSDFAGLPVETSAITEAQYANLSIEGTKKDLVEVARVAFVPLANARQLKSLSVKISGVDLTGFDLNRRRQKLEGNVLTSRVETLPKDALPVQALVGQKSLETYLQGDALMPVFDASIQKKSKEIIGNESNLWKRALLIQDYVYKNLEKVPTVSIPNALEVLQSGKGDCNEHAVLYTTLARAAGVPTRTVVGLVYTDRFSKDIGFYYHAWVEVFTGKDWVSLDPTWNQVPSDATHIAFVEGGIEKQVQVTSLMGKIKLDLVSSSMN